jgi:DNA-binding transcriptional regulator PaaX
MNKDVKTSAIIDGLLRFAVGGGVLATIIVMPNMANVLSKPVFAYFDKLDKRQREREFQRILYYMKQQGLIAATSKGYEHGLVITKKGKERLHRKEFDSLVIKRPKNWDKQWRLVFFDIPEEHRSGRRQLMNKLKTLGFMQLQRSVWVYPFPCRAEIELVTTMYEVQKYVSYVEATGIDSEHLLKKRFKSIL